LQLKVFSEKIAMYFFHVFNFKEKLLVMKEFFKNKVY